jgi:GTP cyclohydrolase I
VSEFTFSSGSRIERLARLVFARSVMLQQLAASLRESHQCRSVVVAVKGGHCSQQTGVSKPAQFVLSGRCRPFTGVTQIVDRHHPESTDGREGSDF